jgi:hypothetical protein
VFVTPAPANGRSLLRRVVGNRAVSHQAEMQQMEQLYEALEDPAFARLGTTGRRRSFEEREPGVPDEFCQLMKVTLEDALRAEPRV